MLGENIKKIRKRKGISQEELAVKLNVVRQTVSKWEKGLSVPDSNMIVLIANELDTTVNVLLGEYNDLDDINALDDLQAKVESISMLIEKRAEKTRKIWRFSFIIIGIFAILFVAKFLTEICAMNEFNSSTSSIGGANGPTNIYVTYGEVKTSGIIALVLAVCSIIGVIKMRRR